MLRFFRSTDDVYESVRAQLDAAWGFPNEETKTQTSISPALESPHDSLGRIYLVIAAEYCEYEAVLAALPSLIAGGFVEEIVEAEYVDHFPLPK
jgi:hypothetical protein